MTFYSQDGQDKFVDGFFNGLENGLVVDVGAHNGITFSNSLFLEETRHWKAVCIEPIPCVFKKLVAKRPNAINVNVACSDTNGNADFVMNSGGTEMLSGLYKEFDPRHHARVKRENSMKNNEGTTIVCTVPTRTLQSIFDEHNITHVNYLSIDVEGAEFSVLKGVDFTKTFIDVIGFENNYSDTSVHIVKYLQCRGFSIISRKLDIFMRNAASKLRA
jgi:FkbM family methyltransferase